MAERGFFVKELNTGWAEWSAAGLPTHAAPELPRGTLRCGCSLHADLVERGGAAPHAPPGP